MTRLNENTGTGSLFGCNKSKFVPVFRLLYPGFGSQDRILRAILWMSWTLWRNGQENQSPCGWSPLGPQCPSRPWFGRKSRVQLPIL